MDSHPLTHSSSFALTGLTLVGFIAVAGFYAGRGARRLRLPSIIGYMLLGVLIGPSILNIFTEESIEGLNFITEMALGFVAFTIGAELHMPSLKRLGFGIVSIIFAESFSAFFVVLALIYLLTRDLPLSLIFASMAPASAPAGTVAVIQEYKARGSLTKALYAVVGFDDGLAIIIFGFAAALARSLLIAEATGAHESLLPALIGPCREIFLSLLVGGLIAVVFCQLVKNMQNPREILILVFGAVLIGAGISVRLHLSLILTNLVTGLVLVNTRREALVHRVVAPLQDIMPLIFVLFFCLAGAHLKIALLPSLGFVGVVYIVGRSVGLIGGARLGAMIGQVDEKVKKYVGLGILSQAGVAIGLSLIVNQDFIALSGRYGIERPAAIGAQVLTSITATCIFFEIIGPILTKIALEKAGEIPSAPRS